MIDDNYFNIKEFIMKDKKSNTVPNLADNHTSADKILMSANGYIASAVILFIIGIFGFFLNFTVIFILVKEKSLRTPFNMILLNLSCSDFSVSIFGNPITFTAAVYRKWIFGRTVCVLYGFFMALTGIASITTITVLSFERYFNIARPFHTRTLNIGHSIRVICGIWLYSLMLTFPPLVGWGDYVNESANISCSVNWEHHNFGATTYIIYLFVMGLAIPVCIICFSYAKIILVLMQKRLPIGRVNKIEVRVALMTAAIVTVFLLAWTPYAVLALIVAFGDPNFVTPAVSVIPALIAKSSICYNPIIYAGLNTQIRLAGCKIFGIKTPENRDRWTGDDLESRFDPNLPNLPEEMITEASNVKNCLEAVVKHDRSLPKKLEERQNEETAA